MRLTLFRVWVALGCWLANGSAQVVAPAAGTIAGVVVDRSDNSPIPRAIVTLSTAEANPREAVAWTDANGRFAFGYLPPGRYELRVAKDRYQQIVYGADSSSRPPGVIELADGQVRSDFLFRLQRAITIRGSVLDEAGDPVRGVQINVLRWGWRRQKRRLLLASAGVSDGAGKYRITGLPSGSYIIAAFPQPGFGAAKPQPETAPGHSEPRYSLDVQYYPGTDRAAAATLLRAEPGHEYSEIDFHLAAQPNRSVQGRLLLPPGAGTVEQPSVYGRRTEDPFDTLNLGAGVGEPELTFAFNQLTPGAYTFVAQATAEGKLYRGVLQVEVGTVDLRDVTIPLQTSIDLAGTVSVEGTGAAKFRPSSVSLVPGGDIPWNGPALRSPINKDGSFKITGVPAGIWDIDAGPVPSGGYIKSMRLGNQDVLTEEMVIDPSVQALLKIVIGTRAATVEGDVTSNGHLARAIALLAPETRFNHVVSLYRVVAADADGHFVFKNVAPGNYQLYAFDEFDRQSIEDPEFRKKLDSRGVTVALREGDNPPVKLRIIPAEDPLSRAARGDVQ